MSSLEGWRERLQLVVMVVAISIWREARPEGAMREVSKLQFWTATATGDNEAPTWSLLLFWKQVVGERRTIFDDGYVGVPRMIIRKAIMDRFHQYTDVEQMLLVKCRRDEWALLLTSTSNLAGTGVCLGGAQSWRPCWRGHHEVSLPENQIQIE